MEYLRIEEVINFHDLLIEKYGGASGIRDLGLLNSAVNMPKQSFSGVELHQSVYEKGAAYFYHLIKNHAFVDGNKRTGVFCCLVFFRRTGVPLTFDQMFLEELAVAVASNNVDKTMLARLLQAPSQAMPQ